VQESRGREGKKKKKIGCKNRGGEKEKRRKK
jgi:hypothetical protein